MLDERAIMQTHTTIGADTLQKVARQHGFAAVMLQMASDIARHHHERFDGKGYPDRLAANDIPLSARHRGDRGCLRRAANSAAYKPALSHDAALQSMNETAPGQFRSLALQAFRLCANEFARIAEEDAR